ncbi:MAG: family 10 glycosylhydrolase, partial [Oligosphaeraceae bacterium]|nr:family 10 glycosylhydrolase [Oligosphaeraceae bacterium]
MLRLLYISCLLLTVLLSAQEIAVLQGRQRPGSPPQAELDLHARAITDCLQALSLPWKNVRDDHVSASELAGCKILFLPQNHLLAPETAAAVTAFVQSGGKLGVFYNQDPQILPLLGISRCQYVDKTALGAVSGLQFTPQAWPGSPSFLAQRSYNLLEPVLDRSSPQPAAVLATFRSQDGQDSGRPGIVANHHGFYMSHVYLGQDNAAAQQFLLAFIGHWLPAVWQRLSEQRLQQIVDIAGLQSLDDLARFCRHRNGGDRAEQALHSAQKLQQEAQTAFTAKLYSQAYRLTGEARRQARLAFALASPSRDGELRGVWLHSPYGIADWGWDKTVRVLAENGFNAIFPNLLWGYVADYPSAVLPQHPSLGEGRDKRDLLQECLDACRKYHVEMHVWKVNWFMGHRTPPALREAMQKAGRTQVTVDGQQTLFLAPHLEENFRLELESMLEIVQRYPVDGLHFDYIRYPDGNCDFSDSARAAFEASLGAKVERWPQDCLQNGRLYSEYTLWRQENITRLVREVSQQAKALRPEIKISAAVYGNWESARFAIAQDALSWVEDRLLDFVCPMNYESSAQEFSYYLQEQARLVQNRLPIYPGIGIHLLEDPAAAAEQIQLARQLGADGFVCFQHNR